MSYIDFNTDCKTEFTTDPVILSSDVNKDVAIIMDMFSTNSDKCKTLSLDSISNTNIKIDIIFELLNNINNEQFRYKKIDKYYDLLKFIIIEINSIYNSNNVIENLKIVLDHKILSSNLLLYISIITKNKYLMELLNTRYIKILNMNIESINNYLLNISKYGNIISFIFWLSNSKYKYFHNIPIYICKDLFVNSIANNDNRIFKYLITKLNIHIPYIFNNSLIITQCIEALCATKLSSKIILKRFKILSEYVNLTQYLDNIMVCFNDSHILLSLYKVYSKESMYSITKILINKLSISNNNIFVINLEYLLNNVSNIYDKYYIFIIVSLNNYYVFDDCNYNITILEKVIMTNINDILTIILNKPYDMFINLLDIKLNKLIFSIITKNNLLTIYYYKFITLLNIKYLFFTRFYNVYYNKNIKTKCNEAIIHANKILHHMRIYAKKIYNNRIHKYIQYKFNVNCELLTFYPNKQIPVLTNGSYYYKLSLYRFNNIINIIDHTNIKQINNNTIYLITNFICGLSSNLSILTTFYNISGIYNCTYNCTHNCNDIFNMKVIQYMKNIYFTLDIDISNTIYEERYEYYRCIFYNKILYRRLTNSSNTIIYCDNILDIIKLNKIEQDNINYIYNNIVNIYEEHDNIYYPLLTIKININDELISNILDYSHKNKICFQLLIE